MNTKMLRRVLPGGDLNEVYTAYLDKIAAYGLALQAKGIPVLFRPFHENNGSWFWWGAAHCSASEFKNLYRYTEEYLRDEKGVHNFLYVYSPNGPIATEADYLTRYPGDAFIDVPGVDMYHEKPQAKDNWMENFGKTLDVVQAFAEKHKKITTVPESGILCGKDTLGRTGMQRPDWFSEELALLSSRKFPYFSTWSNFNADVFDEPYLVDKKRGHEMVDGFTRFYNDPRSVFAGQMPAWQKLPVKVAPAALTYGYLLVPSSNARITGPTAVRAKAAGNYQATAFRLTDASGNVLAQEIAARSADGLFHMDITTDLLKKIGKTVGNVEFLVDEQVADSLRVFYNMPKTKAPLPVVDDFESYYGDNELLRDSYSTNFGPGCSLHPGIACRWCRRAQRGHARPRLPLHDRQRRLGRHHQKHGRRLERLRRGLVLPETGRQGTALHHPDELRRRRLRGQPHGPRETDAAAARRPAVQQIRRQERRHVPPRAPATLRDLLQHRRRRRRRLPLLPRRYPRRQGVRNRKTGNARGAATHIHHVPQPPLSNVFTLTI